MRLFLAVFPPLPVREAVFAAAEPLRQTGAEIADVALLAPDHRRIELRQQQDAHGRASFYMDGTSVDLSLLTIVSATKAAINTQRMIS